jgi:hypothetical protein
VPSAQHCPRINCRDLKPSNSAAKMTLAEEFRSRNFSENTPAMLLAHYADILRRHLRTMVSTVTPPALYFVCQRYASLLDNPQFPHLNMLHHTSVEVHALRMALL